MAMKEVQSINNYPICDTEARKQLENKADANHEHDGYATESYVTQIFNNIDINDFDMSDFVTQDELEDAMKDINVDVDLSDCATKDELNDAIDDVKDYVNEQITGADPEIDLSDYAKKTDVPTKVSQLENDSKFISYYDIYLKDENGDFILDEDDNYIIEDFVSKNEMEKYVDEAILGIDMPDGEPVDLSAYQTKNDSGLNTNNKTIVGAINELFQNANNGKEIIADAIGEPLNANDTFSAMGNKMDGLLDTFKTNMSNQGVPVESNDKFASLINKIPMIQGNGKIQYATGDLTDVSMVFYDQSKTEKRTDTLNVEFNLDFEPTIIFVKMDHVHHNGTAHEAYAESVCISNLFESKIKSGYSSITASDSSRTVATFNISNLTSNGFKLTRSFDPYLEGSYDYSIKDTLLSYYAIGITNE